MTEPGGALVGLRAALWHRLHWTGTVDDFHRVDANLAAELAAVEALLVKDGRCGSCRHWSRFSDDRYVPFGYKQGTCSLTTVLQGDARHPESKARAEAVLFADDVGIVNRFLSTDEDFGCIQWEAKA